MKRYYRKRYARRRVYKRRRVSFKRRRYRRGGRRNKMYRTGRVPSLLPNRMFVTLRCTSPYHEIATGSSSLSQKGIRGNGAYDPWVAVGGPSPKYFNWYAKVYENYRVHAAKIYVTFYNRSNANVSIGGLDPVCGIYITDGTLYSTVEECMEEVTCKWMNVPPLLVEGAGGQLQRPGIRTKTMKHQGKTKLIKSVTNVADFISLNSPVNNVPASEWFFYLFAGWPKGNTEPLYVDARVTIVYKMEFYDRQEIDV